MRYQLGTLLRYLYAAIAVIGVWWSVVLIAKPHMSLLPSPRHSTNFHCVACDW
jgi:hypothetical protein